MTAWRGRCARKRWDAKKERVAGGGNPTVLKRLVADREGNGRAGILIQGRQNREVGLEQRVRRACRRNDGEKTNGANQRAHILPENTK